MVRTVSSRPDEIASFSRATARRDRARRDGSRPGGSTGRRSAHDVGGEMPVEMVRASLTGQPLTRDYKARWKFYEAPGTQSTESNGKR
jgi:hypothetical protein